MKSMTGFGRHTVTREGNSVSVSISSVNSRKQMDIRMSLPRELAELEPVFRQQLQERLSRGSFQVTLTISLGDEARRNQVQLDAEIVSQIVRQTSELRTTVGGALPMPTWGDLLAIPGVLQLENASQYESLAAMGREAFEKAIEDLAATRAEEGRRLQEDLLKRGDYLSELLSQIESREDEAVQLQKKKLQERIASLGLELPIDDEKLSREVIFYVEKADITEETVRLKSHLVRYRALLTGDGDPGRDLDFLGQEMSREINTLSAKTADMSIAETALKFKTELGRIREQIMNVE